MTLVALLMDPPKGGIDPVNMSYQISNGVSSGKLQSRRKGFVQVFSIFRSEFAERHIQAIGEVCCSNFNVLRTVYAGEVNIQNEILPRLNDVILDSCVHMKILILSQ